MFRQIEKNKTVRLISHLDADGISAVSILVRALDREDINYSISIVHQLKEHIIRNLSNEDHTHFIFTDIGSGQIDDIKKIMKDKRVWIFDHHETNQKKEDNQTNNPTLVHINPHFFGIDGAKEISGSGIVYLFAEKLNKKNQDMAHIALIGAIGDNQEDNGFLRLNSEILDSAISSGNLEVTTGLKLFGAQTKALFKILSFSTDPLSRESQGVIQAQ